MDPTVDIEPFARLILQAIREGNWILVAALALIAVVALVRKIAPFPWIKTKLGGWALMFLMSALGAIATALVAGTAISGGLILTALGIGFAAAGGYEAVRDLLPMVLGMIAKQPVEESKGVASVIPIVSTVTASGAFGKATPEQIKIVEDGLRARGYTKQEDGSWKRI